MVAEKEKYLLCIWIWTQFNLFIVLNLWWYKWTKLAASFLHFHIVFTCVFSGLTNAPPTRNVSFIMFHILESVYRISVDPSMSTMSRHHMVSNLNQIYLYEGGLKSFWPSLRKTRDKRPLGRESNRRRCLRHTKSMIKFFGRSPKLHGHRRQYTGKVKSSRPSLKPTWNTGQLSVV